MVTHSMNMSLGQRNFNNMMQWPDMFCGYETFGTKIT
jgi:hypothetical protein